MASRTEFAAVANLLLTDDLVLKVIRKQFGLRADCVIEEMTLGDTPEGDGVRLHDFLLDLLTNNGRIYRRYVARGACGNYHIDIRGLGGVYFYQASEFGSTGYFLSIEDAASEITAVWNDNLTSYRGRNYREPFAKKALIESSESAKAATSLNRAKTLLSKNESPADVAAWEELLAGAPLQDSAVCAELLERWFGTSLEFPDGRGWNQSRLFRFTLGPGAAVFRQLLDRGQPHVITRIRERAQSEVDALNLKLAETGGVARMGLTQALGHAKRLAQQVTSLIESANADLLDT